MKLRRRTPLPPAADTYDTRPGAAPHARPAARAVWPTRTASLAVLLLTLAPALAGAAGQPGQIDPNIPTEIPPGERLNTMGLLDRVLVSLLQPGSPPLLPIGLALWQGLTVIVVVWTGLRIAFSGSGFRAWDIVSLLMTVSIPLVMLRAYDTPIPGVGMAFPQILPRGADQLATIFKADIPTVMLTELSKLGNELSLQFSTIWNEFSLYQLAMVGSSLLFTSVLTIAGSLLLFAALIIIYAVGMAQILYAKLAIALFVFLGPVFIPFYVFSPLQFLFWGWFKGLLTYSLYSIIAACFLRVWCGIAVGFVTSMLDISLTFESTSAQTGWILAIIPLLIAAVLSSLKIGDIATQLVTGGGGGGSGAMGLATTGVMMASGGAGKIASVAAKGS